MSARIRPMPIYRRIRIYLEQSGRGQLTPRQERRCRHKMNLAEKRERLASLGAEATASAA